MSVVVTGQIVATEDERAEVNTMTVQVAESKPRGFVLTPRGVAMGAALNGAESIDAVLANVRGKRSANGHSLDAKEEAEIRQAYADLVREGLIGADGGVTGLT